MKVLCALVVAFVVGLALAAAPALSQAPYPEQTVRILVGFTPGTAPDVSARLLAEKLSEPLGKTVVVENITGARSEEHTSELQSPCNLVCRLLLEKKKKTHICQARSSIH